MKPQLDEPFCQSIPPNDAAALAHKSLTSSAAGALQRAQNLRTLNRQPRPILRSLNCKLAAVADLKPLGRQTRKHPASQISKIAASLREFGQVLPILTDPNNCVVEGEALVAAARQLGLVEIQAVCVSDLSQAQLRRLRLALNKLPEYATWDLEALKLELSQIVESEPHINLENTGFEVAEIDSILDDGGVGEEDELPDVDEQARPITQVGDQWNLGDHIIRCDDALKFESFAHLLGPEQAGLVFTDPPYNVSIAGNVTRSRFAKRHDFAMAKGELTAPQYQALLQTASSHCARFSKNGSIHFVCIDWRHLRELLAAGAIVYTELKNIVVWAKTNAGMGSLYRSQHELIAVYKSGTAPHINNIELGRHGRNRSNVWHYAGQSTLNGTRKSKLLLHPTVKPVALVADAIRDCSNRGDIILDPFGGAGTTIIAAEKTGRRARLIELNPVYVDVTIQRWQRLTGRAVYHSVTGRPFSSSADQSRAVFGDEDGQTRSPEIAAYPQGRGCWVP
jgi:DNA modification methylase